MRAEVAIRPIPIAVLAETLGQVEDDRDRQEMVLAREANERSARFRLHVRRIDDGQPSTRHPLPGDVVEQLERVARRVLGVLVVGDETAAEVGGNDLGREEVRARERRLAGARRADEYDE